MLDVNIYSMANLHYLLKDHLRQKLCKRTTIFKLLASFIILFISIGLILDKSEGAEYRINKFQEFVNYKDITLPSGKNCFEIKDIHETCRLVKAKKLYSSEIAIYYL